MSEREEEKCCAPLQLAAPLKKLRSTHFFPMDPAKVSCGDNLGATLTKASLWTPTMLFDVFYWSRRRLHLGLSETSWSHEAYISHRCMLFIGYLRYWALDTSLMIVPALVGAEGVGWVLLNSVETLKSTAVFTSRRMCICGLLIGWRPKLGGDHSLFPSTHIEKHTFRTRIE